MEALICLFTGCYHLFRIVQPYMPYCLIYGIYLKGNHTFAVTIINDLKI